ncbi:hypothetical protein CBL_11036 [Carabus blaptoides fortunei]
MDKWSRIWLRSFSWIALNLSLIPIHIGAAHTQEPTYNAQRICTRIILQLATRPLGEHLTGPFGKYQASCRIGQWGINVGKLLSARTSADPVAYLGSTVPLVTALPPIPPLTSLSDTKFQNHSLSNQKILFPKKINEKFNN